MSPVLDHARRNVVAYIALFVALGGTSYAAINLPAGSVGNRQLQRHAVLPINLDPTVGGYVRDWAQITSTGQIVSSSPRAHLIGWSPDTAGGAGAEIIWNDGRIPTTCFAIATVGSSHGETDAFGEGFVNVRTSGPSAVFTTYNAAGQFAHEPVAIALICPHP